LVSGDEAPNSVMKVRALLGELPVSVAKLGDPVMELRGPLTKLRFG
jgi:hypothetical protein